MPPLARENWFTSRLPRNPRAPQGDGHRGEGHLAEGRLPEGHAGEEYLGEGHWGDCRFLPIRRVAAVPHQHPRCFQLAQLLAELALLGEVVAASQPPTTAAH